MKSIRVYLIVVILSLVCLSNFFAALYGYNRSSALANALVDQQIAEKAQSLARLHHDNLSPPAELFSSQTLYQVWQHSALLYRSTNAPVGSFVGLREGYSYVSHDGRRWRTFVYADLTQEEGAHNSAGGSYIVVAEPFDVYSVITEDILLNAILPIIWILPLLGLMVLLIVSLGLRPLGRLADTLDRRGEDNFSAVSVENYPQELNRIVGSINNLFLRIAAVFDRERRFSADAAHELRTPLAALRVNLHNVRESAAAKEDIVGLAKDIDRMGQTIEQLLSLHCVSMEGETARPEICDLAEIVREVVAACYTQIQKREQDITLDAQQSPLRGRAFELELLVRNLVDNAGKYSPSGSEIAVRIRTTAAATIFTIEDSGPGIPESERQRVLDRFYRVGGDRHASGVIGSGLGLSIVQQIVAAHHATMTLSASPRLGGLLVEIRFPLSLDVA